MVFQVYTIKENSKEAIIFEEMPLIQIVTQPLGLVQHQSEQLLGRHQTLQSQTSLAQTDLNIFTKVDFFDKAALRFIVRCTDEGYFQAGQHSSKSYISLGFVYRKRKKQS